MLRDAARIQDQGAAVGIAMILVCHFCSQLPYRAIRADASPNDTRGAKSKICTASRASPAICTSDGRYTVVSGGPRLAPSAPPSGTVWVIDLQRRAVVATVTGVGNDPYGLTILEDRPD